MIASRVNISGRIGTICHWINCKSLKAAREKAGYSPSFCYLVSMVIYYTVYNVISIYKYTKNKAIKILKNCALFIM
nr:MAG TPA: hypothetical protein [Caudoviricetes sp.]